MVLNDVLLTLLEVAVLMSLDVFIKTERSKRRTVFYYLSTFLANARPVFNLTQLQSLLLSFLRFFSLAIDPVVVVHSLS